MFLNLANVASWPSIKVVWMISSAAYATPPQLGKELMVDFSENPDPGSRNHRFNCSLTPIPLKLFHITSLRLAPFRH